MTLIREGFSTRRRLSCLFNLILNILFAISPDPDQFPSKHLIDIYLIRLPHLAKIISKTSDVQLIIIICIGCIYYSSLWKTQFEHMLGNGLGSPCLKKISDSFCVPTPNYPRSLEWCWPKIHIASKKKGNLQFFGRKKTVL